MNREMVLKILLAVVGLLFLAMSYPFAMSLLRPEHAEAGVTMMLSLYVTLGVFLLVAARNPSGHRSVILFAAWSSLAHAGTMVVQSFQIPTSTHTC
jgi:hypothetical protein